MKNAQIVTDFNDSVRLMDRYCTRPLMNDLLDFYLGITTRVQELGR